jgi:peptide/nickel transport system permease protein
MEKIENNNKSAVQAAGGLTKIEKPESQLKVMWDTLKKNKAAVAGLVIIILLFFIAVFGSFLVPYDPEYSNMSAAFVKPGAKYWFGTDQLGRDIFSRVIIGTKISLFVGISAVAFSLITGIILGALSGYFGGRVDSIIMRCMDIMLSIPSILLAITLMAALGAGLDKAIIAIGVVSIPEYARIVRSSILSVKESDYVAAAKIIGNTDGRIIFRHILPNVISSIVVRATLGISGAILDTAALGFLGLGVRPPMAEWGDMLGRARSYIFSAPYTLIFPGLAITLAVLAFNLFGDGLRDALDPKARV